MNFLFGTFIELATITPLHRRCSPGEPWWLPPKDIAHLHRLRQLTLRLLFQLQHFHNHVHATCMEVELPTPIHLVVAWSAVPGPEQYAQLDEAIRPKS